MAILLRSVSGNGQPITDALDAARVPYVIVGMNNLFGTAEAEAARQLFYFMAGRPGVDESLVERVWLASVAGVDPGALKLAIAAAATARGALNDPDEDVRALAEGILDIEQNYEPTPAQEQGSQPSN